VNDGEQPELSARWWARNQPDGLSSAGRLEAMLKHYEMAERRFDRSGAQAEAEVVFDALIGVAAAAKAVVAEAAKAKKQPEMEATVACLNKFPRVIAAARQATAEQVEDDDGGKFGAPEAYQRYLLGALKRLRGAGQMNFGMVLGKKPEEHRIALQKSKSGKALAGMLVQATGLRQMTFGIARNDEARGDTMVLEPDGRDLPGLARKGSRMLKEFQPLPFKKMKVTGEEEDDDDD
jgi:hypothetical protein